MSAIHLPSPITKTFNVTSTEVFDDVNQESNAYLQIVRSDAPQRTWSTIECRMWLLRLLRDDVGLEPDMAVRYALRFNGKGSTMLRQSVERWMADFGDSPGGVIYTTISGYTQAH
jgi:hypothetical protein